MIRALCLTSLVVALVGCGAEDCCAPEGQSGFILEGVVRDEEGPVAGAVLSAVARGDDDCEDGPLFALYTTTADDEGRYSLPIVTLTGAGGARGSLVTVVCVELDITARDRAHGVRIESVDVLSLEIRTIARDIEIDP